MQREEAFLDQPPTAEAREPAWHFRGRTARAETLLVSVWSWAVAGACSAWFYMWLVGALHHLVIRLGN